MSITVYDGNAQRISQDLAEKQTVSQKQGLQLELEAIENDVSSVKEGDEKDSLSASEISELSPLADFFKAIEKDPRIGSTHIGVYASLLNYWYAQGRISPIRFFIHQMIGLAKLSCRDTYFKYVGGLCEYGYIRYERSFNRNMPSEIGD